MSWESVAGGTAAAVVAVAVGLDGYRKSKGVDKASAQTGLALLVENLQEERDHDRARLGKCETDCVALRETVDRLEAIIAELRNPPTP